MVFLSAATVKVLVSIEAVGLVFAAVIDPEFALPLNTFLLIVLTVVAGRNNRKLTATDKKVENTAQAAAHAATAAADAARIARDLGGTVRQNRLDTSGEAGTMLDPKQAGN